MDTPTLKMKVKDLEKEVKNYTTREFTFSFDSIKENISDAISTWKIYVYSILVIFLILLVVRPSFLYEEAVIEGKNRKAFSYKKLLLYFLVFSSLVCSGIFLYNYKKNSSVQI